MFSRLIYVIILIISSSTILAQEEKLEIDGAIQISNSEDLTPQAGTIRWTGLDFEGYTGTKWISLTFDSSNILDQLANFDYYYLDIDNDGYGDSTSVLYTDNPLPYFASEKGDCDDNDATRHPGAPEICDGIDSNCDGLVDIVGPIDCNDFIPCTIDTWNSTTCGCENIASNIACDDGNPCTIGTCDPLFGCESTVIPDCP